MFNWCNYFVLDDDGGVMVASCYHAIRDGVCSGSDIIYV